MLIILHFMLSDEYFMQLAIKQAEKAGKLGEIPVGAILISNNGTILAQTHNMCEATKDMTAHAEILAIGAASEHLGAKILNKCILYVTLEPCPMCAAALYWAQIGKIIYGATDKKRGYSLFSPTLTHPRTIIENGILSEECAQLMSNFFKGKRNKKA